MEIVLIVGSFLGVSLALVVAALVGMRHREGPSGSA